MNYGKLTSLALDPIEKKPLRRFHPGSMILSVGSFGCNLRCPFCQNHEISMAAEGEIETVELSPEALADKALELRPHGNIGVAYTYNEPLAGYEYVRDCAALVHERGMVNVLVTNGTIEEAPWRELLPLIDAVNIDLKGFAPEWYKRLGGNLETVKRSISLAAERCHVEVTTLVIPGENDGVEEIVGGPGDPAASVPVLSPVSDDGPAAYYGGTGAPPGGRSEGVSGVCLHGELLRQFGDLTKMVEELTDN